MATWIHFSKFTNSNYGVVLKISFKIYIRNKFYYIQPENMCSLSTACENKQVRRDDVMAHKQKNKTSQRQKNIIV